MLPSFDFEQWFELLEALRVTGQDDAIAIIQNIYTETYEMINER